MSIEHAQPYVPPVLHVISANIAKWGNPLGLRKRDCTSWADSLQIPTEGSIILHTGCEYQLTPYVQPLRDVLKRVKFQDTLLSTTSVIQRITKTIGLDLTKIFAQVSKRERETFDRLLRMAALTLSKLGVNFAYLKEELYAGALLYEHGLFEEFERQAYRVAEQFRKAGATRIIALTPHAAETLQQVYPRFLSNFDFEVTTYVSVVADALARSGRRLSLSQPLSATLHDPCHLARSLNLTEEPRKVLRAIKNLELKEVASNRELTVCCGAPGELIYPELSELLASRRARELADTGAEAIITLCPFCYASLSQGARLSGTKVRVMDFIEVLYQALGGSDVRG